MALLLSCARTFLDIEKAEEVRALVREPLDWSLVLRIAVQHRIVPILYGSLRHTCPGSVPQDIHDLFQSHLHQIALQNLFHTKELISVLHLLKENNIRALPFKGPVLAVSVYGDLSRRQFGDLDILVHEGDYRRAQSLFISQEYQLGDEYDWETSFVSVDGRVSIDLHQGLTPYEFPVLLNFNGLWKRRRPISLGGSTVNHPSPEDLLIILAVQLAKDAWSDKIQLAKIFDIAKLLQVYHGMDWNEVERHSRRLGVQRIVLVSLLFSAQLLGVTFTKEFSAHARDDRAAVSLVKQLQEQIFDKTGHFSKQFDASVRMHFLFRERMRDKVFPYYVHYIGSKITPNVHDRDVVSLPPVFSFLYYLIRPIRLAYTYGLRRFTQ